MDAARTKQDWQRSATWIDGDKAIIDGYVERLKPHEMPYNLKQKLEECRDSGVVIFENVVDRTLIDKVN